MNKTLILILVAIMLGGGIVWYSATHSKQLLAATPIVTTSGVFVVAGDSIANFTPYAQGFPALAVAQASFPDTPTVYNMAKSGAVMSDLFAIGSSIDSKCLATSLYCILGIEIGANDLRGESWSQFLYQVQLFITQRKAARPWKILLVPVLPQKTQGFPAQRDPTNAAFLAGAYKDASGVLHVILSSSDYYAQGIATDAFIGADNSWQTNPAYFGTDTLPHPSALGQAEMAPYIAAGLTLLSGGLPVPPAQPNGLTAQIILSWTAVPFATSYHIKGSTVSGGPYYVISTVTTPNYTITTTPNAYRYFVVSALNNNGESPNSTEMASY